MRLKGLFLILILFASGFALAASDASRDSLLHWEAAIESESSDAAQAYWELVHYYAASSPSHSLELADKARRYFSAHPNPMIQARIESEAGYALMLSGRFPEAEIQIRRSRKFAESAHSPQALARAIMNQGSLYYFVGNYEAALPEYVEAARRYQALGDELQAQNVYKNIGNVLNEMGQYLQAEKYYRDQISWCGDKPERRSVLWGAHEGLAVALNGQHRMDEAIAHYQEAISLQEQLGTFESRHTLLSGLSNTYLELGKADKAMEAAERGLALIRREGIGFFTGYLYLNRAEALLAMGKFNDALTSAQKGMSDALAQNDLKAQEVAWRVLSNINAALDQPKQALDALNHLVELREKIANDRAAMRVAVLDAAYQSERKQREIDLLHAKTATQEAELAAQRNFTLFGGALVLLLLAGGGFGFYRRYHRRLLAEQVKVNEKLLELDKVKDQVLANTSHELRTPLNGIVGLSELLLMDPLPEAARAHVEMIADSGRRLTKLVNDLLQLSSMRHGKYELNFEAVNLHELVRHVLVLSAPILRGRPVNLVNKVSEALPPLRADRERLIQILHNLVGNAAKFTEQGSVSVTAALEGRMIRISVVDTGGGIPADRLDRIFDVFEQADTGMSRRHEGAGLGLAIAKELVLRHGGEIGVQSTLGSGSLFWFTLPVASAASVH